MRRKFNFTNNERMSGYYDPRRRNFKGYRTFPVYLERVNNFMIGILNNRQRLEEEKENGGGGAEYEEMQPQYGNANRRGDIARPTLRNKNSDRSHDYGSRQGSRRSEYEDEYEAKYGGSRNGVHDAGSRGSVSSQTSTSSKRKIVSPFPSGGSSASSGGQEYVAHPRRTDGSSRDLRGGSRTERAERSDRAAERKEYDLYDRDDRRDAEEERKPRKVTSSDLRNKRNAVNNRSYQSYGRGPAKMKEPTYSVKLAISSGSAQVDTL